MTVYPIVWGHSGTQGHEWTTARAASRYAGEYYGDVEADSAEDAVAIVRREIEDQGGTVGDWYEADDGCIHVVPAPPLADTCSAVRERLGYTLDQMAAALDVDRKTYSRWEQGHTEPAHPGMLRLALARLEEEALGALPPVQVAHDRRDVPALPHRAPAARAAPADEPGAVAAAEHERDHRRPLG